MMITTDNYEIWFLDYLEGKLNEEQREMVHHFLLDNPDLADGLQAYIPEMKVDKHTIYPHKERLKKASYDDPVLFEATAVAVMEEDLTREEQVLFEKWLAGKPDSQKLMNLLANTKLQPDLTIKFPDKNLLKRTKIPLRTWISLASAAAVLMLAFFIFSPSQKKDVTAELISTETQVAPKKMDPVNSVITAEKPSGLTAMKTEKRILTAGSPSGVQKSKLLSVEPLLAETRSFAPIEKLEPKTGLLTSNIPEFADLILIRMAAPVYYASGEIPLSVYFQHRLQALNASQPHETITREEIKIAGLRFFSRIPGNRLTGKKGNDGRLKSISFNTQMLAFSIPVNN